MLLELFDAPCGRCNSLSMSTVLITFVFVVFAVAVVAEADFGDLELGLSGDRIKLSRLSMHMRL